MLKVDKHFKVLLQLQLSHQPFGIRRAYTSHLTCPTLATLLGILPCIKGWKFERGITRTNGNEGNKRDGVCVAACTISDGEDVEEISGEY
jgi:hypothetical protein